MLSVNWIQPEKTVLILQYTHFSQYQISSFCTLIINGNPIFSFIREKITGNFIIRRQKNLLSSDKNLMRLKILTILHFILWLSIIQFPFAYHKSQLYLCHQRLSCTPGSQKVMLTNTLANFVPIINLSLHKPLNFIMKILMLIFQNSKLFLLKGKHMVKILYHMKRTF